MRTNARNGISAEEAAAVLLDPEALTGSDDARHPRPAPERGWMAGRLVDGYDLVIDGQPPVRHRPRWIGELEAQGYRAEIDGAVTFIVTREGSGDVAEFETVRDGLRHARDVMSVADALEPESVTIECRTPTGLSVLVAPGASIIGMAKGALEAPSIQEISGPAEF